MLYGEFSNNLILYFARFCKHLIEVIESNDYISYLDLSHSLRCLVNIKKNIDEVLENDDFHLTFSYIANTRRLKRSSSFEFRINRDIKYKNGFVGNIGFSESACRDDTINNLEFIERSYQNRIMLFEEWLGSEIATFNHKSNTINIENFINRISNKFGGSHPYETEFNIDNDKNFETIYRKIDFTQSIKFFGIECGFLLIKNFSIELANALLPYFIEKNIKNENEIFQDCYNLLEMKKKSNK